jgi:hypothetical protein
MAKLTEGLAWLGRDWRELATAATLGKLGGRWSGVLGANSGDLWLGQDL